MKNSLIVQINQCSEQVYGPVRKLQGLLPPKSVITLLDADDLAANPRSAKKGSVTNEIEETLKTDPDLFPAMTKGILLASSSYKPLERNRYQLDINNPETEGILDGGHNALAVGRHILSEAGLTRRDLDRIKDWMTFRSAWNANRNAISEIIEVLDFAMPVEIQVPADMKNDEILETFRGSLLEIGAARNNNVQLSEETKANKRGYYEIFKEHLPTSLSEVVEWKTNDGGRIRVRDIIALCWIPLSKLEPIEGLRVNPNQIYRNKAVCVSQFNALLGLAEVSTPTESGYSVSVYNESIKSAMKICGDLPELYDLIYEEFPNAHNKAGGSYGKINAVKMYDPEKAQEKNSKYLRSQPVTPFFQHPVNYTCPDGFIVPLMYGLRALMEVNKDKKLAWKTDPRAFIKQNLIGIMKSYRLAMDMSEYDPQKLGKNIGSYEFADNTVAAIHSITQTK